MNASVLWGHQEYNVNTALESELDYTSVWDWFVTGAQ